MSRRKMGADDARPGKCHSRTHQLARKSQTVQAQRSDFILDDPRKLADACHDPCVSRSKHQIQRLNGARGSGTNARESVDRAWRGLAVGVDDDDEIRRIAFEVPYAEI